MRKLESHIADCKHCLQSLAFLARNSDEPQFDSVPPHLLVKARSLAAKNRNFALPWRWVTVGAAACVLVIAVFVVWRMRSNQVPNPPTGLVAQQQPPTTINRAPINAAPPTSTPVQSTQAQKPAESPRRTVRGENDDAGPSLIFPRDGEVMRPNQQTLRWKAVPGASSYEVKVVTSDGGPVFTESTSATQVTLDPKLLQPGNKYFLTVVAHLVDMRTVKTTVSFRLVSP